MATVDLRCTAGRGHDLSCGRAHGIIDAPASVRGELAALADLGYAGAADVLRVPHKKA
jgi:hypothetical protein